MTPGPAPSPPLPWRHEYELGIDDVDLQHHSFANLINRLAGELPLVSEAALRTSLLQELGAYARFHFISEENLMARAGYPGLAEHRLQHNELIDQLSARQLRVLMRGSEVDVDEVLKFLVQWFLGHTQHADRAFADFVHAKAPRGG